SLASRRDNRATRPACRGKNDLDHPNRRAFAEVRDVLGALMQANRESPSLLDVVALLADAPEHRLTRGQVGTVAECLDDKTFLVEFSDEQGRAYAIVPCRDDDLLVLHYHPEAA